MYPKLNPDPVSVTIGEKTLRLPRKHLSAAYAGAYAAKECTLWESNPLTQGLEVTFREKYNEVMPACIVAANNVGLSAVCETLDHWNPGKSTDRLLKDRLGHPDNPAYPFFDED